jgi:transcriptional repressor NrdR
MVMTCPSCGGEDSKVVDSRPVRGEVVRRRVCTGCGRRFTTTERITAENMRVRKRDGRVEPFNRAKLGRGILKAAGAFKLTPAEVKAYVDRVVQILQPEAPNLPIESSHIGDLVLQQLHNDALTDVVRVRYAMVLRGRTTTGQGFHTLGDFLAWLKAEHGEPRIARPVTTPSTVIKRSGKREAFEFEKLARSVGISGKGRGSDAEVRTLANAVAAAVREALVGQSLVTSSQIAAEVLRLLRGRDPLLYLRYSSSVKRYQSVDDFWMDAFGLDNA